jgi:hypothetical protein
MNVDSGHFSTRFLKGFTTARFIVFWGIVICFIPEFKALLQAITQWIAG